MQPAESLFHLDKVSKDFYYSNEIMANPVNRRGTSIKKLAMPWNATGNEFEFFVQFDFKKGISYNFSNIFQPLDGILVIVHSPNELITQSSQRFYLRDFRDYEFFITPEVVTIADDLRAWPVEARNCFFDDERKLNYFKVYTKNNCEQECLSNAAYEKCGCVPFYLIRSPLQKICGFDQLNCFKNAEMRFEIEMKGNCGCLNLCNDMKYKITVTDFY